MKLFILLAIVKRLRVSNTRFNSQKTSKPVHGNKMQKLKLLPQATHMCNTKGEGMGKVQSNINRKDKIILNKRKNNCNILIIRLKCCKKKCQYGLHRVIVECL